MNKLIVFFRESSTARFLVPLGIFLIVFGVFMFIVNDKNKDYIKTEAVVSNMELVQDAYTDENGDTVEATYNVYVKYTVDGTEYNEELGEASNLKEGEKITIYYNPDDPTKITQTTSLILPIVIIAGGCCSLIGGIVSAVNSMKKYNKMKEQERRWANE